jgi:hypothetical protein
MRTRPIADETAGGASTGPDAHGFRPSSTGTCEPPSGAEGPVCDHSVTFW